MVKVAVVASLTVTLRLAVGALTDVGVYPTCFANETRLARMSALSMNISFANILAL